MMLNAARAAIGQVEALERVRLRGVLRPQLEAARDRVVLAASRFVDESTPANRRRLAAAVRELRSLVVDYDRCAP